MTRKEWLECLKLARNPSFEDSYDLELGAFDGIALDKTRRAATKIEVASWIIRHCATFGGTWLHAEERELESFYPRIDLIG